jgi:hypothetical protein
MSAGGGGVEVRSKIDAEATKGALIINGGLAAGLGSMLPKILESTQIAGLARYMIVSIAIACAGLMCAIIHSRLRRKCSLAHAAGAMNRQPYEMWPFVLFQTVPGEPKVCTTSIMFFWSSLICFGVGIAIVCFGAWLYSHS